MLAQIENDCQTRSVEAATGAKAAKSSVDALSEWLTPLRFALLLAALLVATFPGVLAGQQSFFFRDYGVLSYPTIFYARESFWRGELPLWNPLSHCGVPFLAQWGAMVLYPFSVIYLLFPLPWSLGLFVIVHLLLGGCGMYALATRWTGHRLGAAIAGVAFVFNGVVFSSLAWPNYAVALGWMPWVVLATQSAYRNGGRMVFLAGLAGAMQMLSGVPEVILLTWGFLALLFLTDLARIRRCWASGGLRFAGVVALVTGLSAAQLLPFFELMAHSHRHSGFGTAAWSMPPWGWANLLVPLFRCAKTSQGIFYQPGHVFLITYYLGIAVLVLAAMALLKRRNARLYLLAGCALFGLILSLGDAGYVYSWLKQTFPVVGFVRYPIKSIYLTIFAVPLLAAYGTHRLLTNSDSRPVARFCIMIAGVAAAGCATLVWAAWQFPAPNQNWPATAWNAAVRVSFLFIIMATLLYARRLSARWQPLLGALLLVALWLDAQTHTALPHPTIHASNLAPGLSPMKSPPKLGEGRVLITDWAEDRLYRSGVADFRDDFVGKRLGLWCNLHLLEGIPKVEGASTLLVAEQFDIQSLFYRTADTEHPALANFLGVTQVTAPGEVTEWATRSNSLPLITAGQNPVLMRGTNVPGLLTSKDFDPRRSVYVTEPVSADGPVSALIENVDFQRHRISFSVQADGRCLVTIAQTFYPAWRAFVDAREVKLLRANHAFQAVEVPSGKHDVRLVYKDSKFRLGAVISIATLCFCGIGLVRVRRSSATE